MLTVKVAVNAYKVGSDNDAYTPRIIGSTTPLSPNNIYCMVCLDGLRRLPHDSVDLVFADPPYNIGADYGNGDTSLEEYSYV